jgi:Zn-dependent protease
MFGAFLIATPLFGLPLLFIALGLFVILLVHELGHAFLAVRLGYEVEKISIYPIHGLCYYDEPYSEYENSVIAWGGVAAQLLLFIPATAILGYFGNTTFGSVNVLLVTFSYINGVSMVVNLAPGLGLDGTKAWRVLPILAKAKWSIYQLKRRKMLK